jgi:hypothetical protein
MKKTSAGRRNKRQAMRREYRFDYGKSRPNRFASLMKGETVAVVLDPDVASVFRSPEGVAKGPHPRRAALCASRGKPCVVASFGLG